MVHKCGTCNRTFSVKSNLTCHMKTHESKSFECQVCHKTFTLKLNLDAHAKQHKYPVIPLYNIGEAKLRCSKEAEDVAKRPSKNIDAVWLEPHTAETAAKKSGQDMWRADVIITFGKYKGKSFKWLLENDVGWVVWLLDAFCRSGETCPNMKWQKECLLELVNEFPVVKTHLDKRLKKQEEKKQTAADVSFSQEPGYVEDAELLAHAENVLQESQEAVSTQITIVGKLVPSSTISSQDRPVSPHQATTSTDDTQTVVLEGWQKFWDEPPSQDQGILAPNVKWLKSDSQYGIFQLAKPYKNARGEMVQRKVFKEKIKFDPPPIPATVKGSLPSMMSFFTTPVLFWRPVGVMEVKIKCPNANCPAPAGSYLTKSGFGNFARKVCGMNNHYTLLTERLRHTAGHETESDSVGDYEKHQQYRWQAYSPDILLNLAPAVRSLFPAVLCGKRAIDKNVLTLLDSVSMTKVQRLLQQGHDEWYAERRDLYQTLLYHAHTASSASQQGILSFLKPAGSYNPPRSLRHLFHLPECCVEPI